MTAEEKAEVRILAFQVYNLRKQLGWSRETLAIEAGVSTNTITAIETGATVSKFVTVKKLAAGLHCSLDYLYGLDEVSVETQSLQSHVLATAQKAIRTFDEKKLSAFARQTDTSFEVIYSL